MGLLRITLPCPSIRYYRVTLTGTADSPNEGEAKSRAHDEFNAKSRQLFDLLQRMHLFSCEPVEGQPNACLLVVRSDAFNHEYQIRTLANVSAAVVPQSAPPIYHAVCEGTQVFAVACGTFADKEFNKTIRDPIDAHLANRDYQDFSGHPVAVADHEDLECPINGTILSQSVVGYECRVSGTHDAAGEAAALARWSAGFSERVQRAANLLAHFLRCKPHGPSCQGRCDDIPTVEYDLTAVTKPTPTWDAPDHWRVVGGPEVTFAVSCRCRRWF